jgi:hypothetical protein
MNGFEIRIIPVLHLDNVGSLKRHQRKECLKSFSEEAEAEMVVVVVVDRRMLLYLYL